MKTGTCYFPSYGAALRYYRPYAEFESCDSDQSIQQQVRALVDRKLNSGEIHIGRPDLKPGETLSIEDNRYHITEAGK